MRAILICLVFLSISLLGESQRSRRPNQKSERGRAGSHTVKERKPERTERATTTVVSCRVFKRGTCKQTKENIILTNPSVKSKSRCQQLCFATQRCAGFTFYEGGKTERRRCVLSKDCRGERGRCSTCISGPIMPRINECLAGRLQVVPSDVEEEQEQGDSCPAGCVPVCSGSTCGELTTDATKGADDSSFVVDDSYDDYTNSNPLSDSELYEVDYVDEDKLADVTDSSTNIIDEENDYYSNGNEVEESEYDYSYDDYDDYDENDIPVEQEAVEIEEEEEDVDINIDDGFLNDENNEPVELPIVARKSNVETPNRNSSVLLVFLLIGGLNPDGSVINIIDLLNTGLGNSVFSLSIPPLPSAVTEGGETSAAYTDKSITTCGRGVRSLTPYGFTFTPGSCYAYDIQQQKWGKRGGKMNSYRKGASVTKLGRYLLASGGYRQKRSISTMEVYDPEKPKAGWKSLGRLQLPTGVSEHCTVVMRGRNGKEVVITGGRGKRNRAMKLNMKTRKWYSLNEMNRGRQNHACIKASLNGHPGLIVSGGSSSNSSLSSVEFYNAKTGSWLKMPRMRKARSGHVMTITQGRLMVAGGERKGKSSLEVLDDIEIFTGKRWVKSKQKMQKPRSRFSLVKVPKKDTEGSKRRTKN